jgi:hypothetical protein
LELQAQLTETGSAVRAIAAHPGIAKTDLIKRAGGSYAVLDQYLGWLFNDAEHGALPIEYAATQDVPEGSYVGPGLGHLRGYPELHQPAKTARDPEMARRIWALSARLTGIEATIKIPVERDSELRDRQHDPALVLGDVGLLGIGWEFGMPRYHCQVSRRRDTEHCPHTPVRGRT